MQRASRVTRAISAALAVAIGGASILPATAIADTSGLAGATGTLSDGSSITQTSDDTFVVSEDGRESTITVMEADGTRTVTIVDSLTGESNEFVYDEGAETIYSSYTGNTIDANDIKETSGPVTRSSSTHATYSFDYASIKSAVGSAGNVVSLTGFILSKTGAFTMDAGPVITLGAILSGISGVIPNDSYHGIRVTVTTTKYYRNGNRIPYRTTKAVTGLTTY